MKYTVDFFIKKFEAIPENRWTSNELDDGVAKCAAGHCGITRETISNPNREAVGLIEVLQLLKIKFGRKYGCDLYNVVAHINDGECDQYQQPTPKQRILAALYDIKQMQQPEVRIKTVYVSVPVSITEQIKELIQS